MARKSLFVVLLTAATLAGCSVDGGPPSANGVLASPSASPTATPAPLVKPSAADIPSLVPCPSGGTPEAPIMLSPEEALSCDLRAMAEGRGTTLEDEYARYQTELILDEITTRVSRERPDVFIGAALSEQAGGPPTLYIKGPADEFIRKLVAQAEIEILIADNQPYSAEEIDERQARIGVALQDIGFTNFAVGNDIRTGRFHVAVTIEAGLPDEPDEIVALLPHDLRGDLDLTVSETPVAVDTIGE